MDSKKSVDVLLARESHDIKHFSEGITRKVEGEKFVYYYNKNNKEVSKKDQLRINKLRIPPAWENVWISNDPTSSIQVIGEDNSGKKQYIYHQEHIKEAEREKFLRLYKFILAIPKLEAKLKDHETLPIYNKDKVIATMLKVVKLLHIRVGKEQYAQKNKSYGITSLLKTHIKLGDTYINLKFKGKSNQHHFYTLKDKEIITHIKQLLKLGGEKLFQYISETGNILKVSDADLNEYIQKYMGKEFTAKDFRTYAANHHFVDAILNQTKKRIPNTPKKIKVNLLNAINITKHYLRHTKAVSKKSYIMSFCVELYQSNPELFITHKNDDPDEFLLYLLKIYKNKVLD